MTELEEKIAVAKEQLKDLKGMTSFKAYHKFLVEEYEKHIKNMEMQLEEESKEDECGFIPADQIKCELNQAMMKMEFPFPDEVDSTEELIEYVKSVYGIHGDIAELFDHMITTLNVYAECLKRDRDEYEKYLRKALKDELSYSDWNMLSMRFSLKDDIEKIMMAEEKTDGKAEIDESEKECCGNCREKNSSKPDGSLKEFLHEGGYLFPDDVAEELMAQIREFQPKVVFTEDLVVDLSKFVRCSCKTYKPDRDSGMCVRCLGCHPTADGMTFHPEGFGFMNFKEKK
jgi:hypothetical protein